MHAARRQEASEIDRLYDMARLLTAGRRGRWKVSLTQTSSERQFKSVRQRLSLIVFFCGLPQGSLSIVRRHPSVLISSISLFVALLYVLDRASPSQGLATGAVDKLVRQQKHFGWPGSVPVRVAHTAKYAPGVHDAG